MNQNEANLSERDQKNQEEEKLLDATSQNPVLESQDSQEETRLLLSADDTTILSQTEQKWSQTYLRGLVWCMVFGLNRGGMYTSQKMAEVYGDARPLHTLLIRSICMAIGAFMHGWMSGVDMSRMGYNEYKRLPSWVQGGVMSRSMYGFGSFIATLISIELMPVSISVAVTMMAVFVTTFLGWLIADEAMSKIEISSMIGGFMCVVILTNPDLLFENHNKELNMRDKEDEKEYPYFWVGVFFALLFTVFSAMNFITIRGLGD
jgi:drug/metabolite transporter (DMT)-like permease